MPDRVSVLGEFGGLGLPIPGHLWVDSNNWGYRTYTTREELAKNYEGLIQQMPSLIAGGLAAAVYTQTTDVEIEVNGLLTYDRQIIKFDPEWMAKLHAPLYAPPPRRVVVAATSESAAQTWRFTTTAPTGEGWTMAEFDDSAWTSGPGGFGTKITPNTTVRTEWNTPDIWVRRPFTLGDTANPDGKTRYNLRVFHDEDAEVYLNGRKVASLTGYLTGYQELPVPEGAVQAGKNQLAVHCKQTTGGQYIDVGIVGLSPVD
jgi:hypothetical protein